MQRPRSRSIINLVSKLKKRIYKLQHEVKDLKNQKTIEIVKEIPVEVIKEIRIPERVEVPVEVIKEVPYEVIKEVPKEIIKEVIKVEKVPERIEIIKEIEVKVPFEVIKEVEVKVPFEVVKEIVKEVPVEVIKEVKVPYEVIKEVIKEVPKEVKVFVPTEDLEAKKRYEEEIANFTSNLQAEKQAKKALEDRYQAAVKLSQVLHSNKVSEFTAQIESDNKKYKRLFTYAYLTVPYILSQILFWMVT